MKLLHAHVAVVVPHRQFNDTELDAVLTVLAREGARVKLTGSSLQPAVGMRGATVRPQLLLSDCAPSKFDALVFIGGIGAHDFWEHPRAHNMVRAFHAHGRMLAAICIAPVTLARAGILKGRIASCHPSAMRELESAGAVYSSDPVHVDGGIITAGGPAAAQDFAEAIVTALAARCGTDGTLIR